MAAKSTATKLKTATTEVKIASATAPSAGQVLTATSSTEATWQTPSGGAGGKSFIMSTIFERIDRLNTADYIGSSTITTSGLAQTTTSATDSYSSINTTFGGAGSGTILKDGLIFTYQGYLSMTSAGFDAMMCLGSPTLNDLGYFDYAPNSARIGFTIRRRSSGNITLYASVANGSAYTETALTTFSTDSSLELKLVYNTTSVDFYYAINDAALSTATTISTNIPTSLSNRVKIGISNASQASAAAGSLYSGFTCVQY